MKCPKCSSETETVDYDNIQVDRCTACKGIWFDSQEHDALVEKEGSESIDTGDVSIGRTLNKKHDIICPRCMVFMETIVDSERGGLTYEKCPSCGGIYLDAGEFKESKQKTMMELLKSFQAE